MQFLLDTHTFIWAVSNPEKLGVASRSIIEDGQNEILVSAVSAFEITNKYRIGKLPGGEIIVDNYSDLLQEYCFGELPITRAHAFFAGKFPWEHRDPFDRILAAQASVSGIPLLTNDQAFKQLPWLETCW